MKRQALVVLCTLVVVGARPTSAQRIEDSQTAAGPHGQQTSRDQSAPTRAQKIVGRTIVGTGAMVAAGFIGGWAGYGVERAMAGSDCYDFCGVGGMLLGLTVGGLLGAATGVSMPFASQCKRADRFGRALGGAALGALLGGVSAYGLQKTPILAVPLAITAPALTAALIQGDC